MQMLRRFCACASKVCNGVAHCTAAYCTVAHCVVRITEVLCCIVVFAVSITGVIGPDIDSVKLYASFIYIVQPCNQPEDR